MIGSCEQFDSWLDAGREAALAASASAHAAGCRRCAGALELEALLVEPPVARSGAEFTEGVLFRVRDAERSRAAARLEFGDAPEPWWLRAPAEPSAALALMAAAMLAWRGDGLWSSAVALALRVRAHDWTHGPGSGLLDPVTSPFALAASGTLASGVLLSALVVGVGLASWWLYRAIERVVGNTGAFLAPLRAPGLPHAR